MALKMAVKGWGDGSFGKCRRSVKVNLVPGNHIKSQIRGMAQLVRAGAEEFGSWKPHKKARQGGEPIITA